MDAQGFRTRLANSTRGDQIVYHNGLLMRDRQLEPHTAALANAVWSAYEDGACILVQRRVSEGVCCYVAVRL